MAEYWECWELYVFSIRAQQLRKKLLAKVTLANVLKSRQLTIAVIILTVFKYRGGPVQAPLGITLSVTHHFPGLFKMLSLEKPVCSCQETRGMGWCLRELHIISISGCAVCFLLAIILCWKRSGLTEFPHVPINSQTQTSYFSLSFASVQADGLAQLLYKYVINILGEWDKDSIYVVPHKLICI